MYGRPCSGDERMEHYFCGLAGACYVEWLDRWQTLITGILALIAAGVAAKIGQGQLAAAKGQINLQRELDARARQARLRAARAKLPLALSRVCSYASGIAKELQPFHGASDMDVVFNHLTAKRPAALDAFPDHPIAVLEAVIEFVEDEAVAQRIESILREAQVMDARLQQLDSDHVSKMWVESIMLQAASIYARAESLFYYARNQAQSVSQENLWERTFAAFTMFGLHGQQWDDLKGMAKRSRERGESPGEADERLDL